MSNPSFKDHFSKYAELYARHRPIYPEALFEYLASLTKEHELVWDCGTGNGQAATGLVDFYKQVVATDPSEEQIAHCVPHENIEYRVEKAEHSSLRDGSVDLLTIATALHWFDFDPFYAEARRVMKPGAIIAAWAYSVPSVDREVDLIVRELYNGPLNDYWLAENRMIDKEYSTVPFPFQPIEAPEFIYEKRMTAADFIQYLNTWSALQRYIRTNGFNPTDKTAQALQAIWQKGEEKIVRWKLILKVGRNNPV